MIEEAVHDGAGIMAACEIVGITSKTYWNWKKNGMEDRRSREARAAAPVPRKENHRKLSEQEVNAMVERLSKADVVDMPPTQAFYYLADLGEYYCSISTIYRCLRMRGLAKTRRPCAKPKKRAKPHEYKATGPNQVWTWDITYFRDSSYNGRFYYVYAIVDIFTRDVVHHEEHDADNADYAKKFLETAFLKRGIKPKQLVLHSDNGSSMKAAETLAVLDGYGIKFSHSRPRVSDDNPFSESFFKTMKYCGTYPKGGFATLEAASKWVEKFVRKYHNRFHSGINNTTPQSRLDGTDKDMLERRAKLLEKSREAHPERWINKKIMNCDPVLAVMLNPDNAQARCGAKAVVNAEAL